jgi:protocatechuate 3,4-dioxygenase beta subunit
MRYLIPALFAVFLQSSVALQSGSISGVVVDRMTEQPIPGARVELRLRDGESERGPVLRKVYQYGQSGSDGTFKFSGVIPGDYQIVLSHPRYLKTLFIRGMGSSNAGPLPHTVIRISAGDTVSNLRIKLTPGATVSGRLIDQDGKPFRGAVTAVVPATSSSFNEGILAALQSAAANDLGEYRLEGLPPGPYFLRAGRVSGPDRLFFGDVPLLPRVMSDGSIQDTLTRRAYNRKCDAVPGDIADVYYPGTFVADEAAVLDVTAGENKQGINFTLSNAALRSIRGTFVTSNSGTGQAPYLELFPQSSFPDAKIIGCRAAGNNTFELHGVSPGTYLLRLRTEMFNQSETLVITNRDVDVHIPVVPPSPPVSFTGTVHGNPGVANVISHPGVNLRAYPLGPKPWSRELDGTGVFSFSAVQPGRYFLDLVTVAPACCVPDRLGFAESARLNNVDASDGVINIVPGVAAVLDVKVGTPVRFSGRLVDRKGQPVENVVVALVPDPPLRNRLDLYRTALTGRDGGFSMLVAKGRFKAFAKEGVEDKAWEFPSIIRAYENRGKAVQIGNEAVNLELVLSR